MSLFGAATSGVSPQTGSYLSKEERIAMFKAASGRRGYRGRSGGGGGAGAGGAQAGQEPIQATSAIVAVNSVTTTMQKLQISNQQSVQQVQVQVEKNRQNIETLFTQIAAEREAEFLEEKTQTRQDRRRLELGLRAGAEKLLEGLGKAVAGTATALGNVAQRSLAPVRSLLDKLFELLSLLGAAWVIDNLPAILDAIQDFTANLPTISDVLQGAFDFLTSTRGVFGILDSLFQPLKRLIGNILRKALNVFKWIGRKTTDIFKAIFRKIKNFVTELFSNVRKKAIEFFDSFRPKKVDPTDGLKGADDAAKGADDAVKGADDAVKGADDAAKGVDDAVRTGKGKKNIFENLGSWGANAWNKLTKGAKGAVDFVGDRIGDSKKFFSGIGDKLKNFASTPVKSTAAQQTKFLEKMLSPILGVLGSGASGMVKGIIGIAKKLPFIGMAIDIALNKGIDGMNWTESIIRGISSGTAGAIGGAAGAKAGALAGAALGTVVPGVGNVVGAALGAIVGGFLGSAATGAFGDEIGKVAYKMFTGKDPQQNDNLFDQKANDAMKFLGDAFGFEVQDDIPQDTKSSSGPEVSTSTAEPPGDGSGSGALDSNGPHDSVFKINVPATNLGDLFSSIPDSSVGSTPDGMQLSDGAKNNDESSFSFTELPSEFVDASSNDETRPQVEGDEAQAVPTFPTRDFAMDGYRTLAERLFEVAA